MSSRMRTIEEMVDFSYLDGVKEKVEAIYNRIKFEMDIIYQDGNASMTHFSVVINNNMMPTMLFQVEIRGKDGVKDIQIPKYILDALDASISIKSIFDSYYDDEIVKRRLRYKEIRCNFMVPLEKIGDDE